MARTGECNVVVRSKLQFGDLKLAGAASLKKNSLDPESNRSTLPDHSDGSPKLPILTIALRQKLSTSLRSGSTNDRSLVQVLANPLVTPELKSFSWRCSPDGEIPMQSVNVPPTSIENRQKSFFISDSVIWTLVRWASHPIEQPSRGFGNPAIDGCCRCHVWQ